MNLVSAIDEFQSSMAAAGLLCHETIIADGTIHRFTVDEDRPKSNNGWYLLHIDGIAAGSYGSWKTGETHSWCSKSKREMSAAERNAYREKAREMREQRKRERHQRHEQTAEKCFELWNRANAFVPSTHPYLAAKGVRAYGLRQLNEALLVPIRNSKGELRSLQYIQPDGGKRFKSGGEIVSCYHSIGDLTETLYLCEGYATGATIHEATGCGVVVAFNAGNLKPVALTLREKHPNQKFIIAADNDHKTPGNPGITKAKEAAIAANMEFTYPEFPLGVSGSDFNDISLLEASTQ